MTWPTVQQDSLPHLQQLQSLFRAHLLLQPQQNSNQQKEKADEIGNVLNKVVDAAYTANEVARNIENEIAYQREITDKAKNALMQLYSGNRIL